MGSTGNTSNMAALAIPVKQSLIQKMAEQAELEPARFMDVLLNTILASKPEDKLNQNEVAAFLTLANKYNLDPFAKEIYGFKSKGKLQLIVSIDGWAKIVNTRPEFNGVEFDTHFDDKGNVDSVTCKIHRKDRSTPTVVTEYYRECFRDYSDPWKKSPIRMTRHRSFIQCARMAFSISGVRDEDETGLDMSQPGPALIEATVSAPETPFINSAFDTLGWSPQRRRTALQSYEGRGNELLTYLHGEIAKANGKKAVKAQTIEAAPAAADVPTAMAGNPDADDPEDNQGEYAFGFTAQEGE